jgi:drug/metabolite transporter (DMT)-like permease
MIGYAGFMIRYPRWTMAAGALVISGNAILIDLSGVSPGTAAVYRFLLALPFLVPLAWAERRTRGAPARRDRVVAAAAGALLAADVLLWAEGIPEIGAGLSTVLVNLQVVLVPLLALAIDREPVSRR